MKKLFIVILLAVSFSASAQLTLSEKATLSATQTFRDRVFQAMFSKANFFLSQPAQDTAAAVTGTNNLERSKQINFAKAFSRGSAGSIDAKVLTQLWLANYNGVQILDSNNQPIDAQILNTSALDVVYNLYAGVVAGDNALPPN
jgi:hypothetical protein